MITIPYSQLAEQITITVKFTGANVWRARMWLAVKLFKLAALTLGTDKLEMVEVGHANN